MDLKEISTFKDAVTTLWSMQVLSDEQCDQLTGFGLLPGNRKADLVGVPFLIIQFEFKSGKNDSSFVECHIITTNDERHTLRDSSRGIHEQLQQIYRDRVASGHQNPTYGVYVRKGLTFRDNPYTAPTGEQSTTRTYYLT